MNKYLQNLFTSKKEEVKKKNTLISSLAPKILTKKEDIEKVQPYLDKLNETIDTKGINNIALTGGYGSGKSTIIGTFKALNPQYEYLNISLASFNKKENVEKLSPKDEKLQKEELERLLEVSILQQIFYHVKPSEIPESRFKRIISISDFKMFAISACFILWTLSLVLLIKYDYLDKLSPRSWNSKDSFDWLALLIFVVAFIGVGMLSKLFIQLFSNSKINKVNIKGELELGDNVNKSVFNEHLEEILYFFEQTKYDVVLIEDLDRFDSTDIFTKLREINILLNNSKLINREINFVYAVGDDLFNDKKERVKFFEYIIPVIPFINSSNADEQLKTLISEAGLNVDMFTKEFISDVTTFIDDIDMRLLTNIFHEFVIYRNTLKPEFITKNDELFAMITYKNIDPKDFTELNKKEGKLYNLINNKRNYIKKLLSKVDTENVLKDIELKEIEKHTTADIQELRSIYINKVITKLNVDSALSENKIIELLEDDGFETLMSGNISFEKFTFNRSYNMYSKSNNNFSFVFNDIENEVNSDYKYEERVKLIESKKNKKIDLLKSEIEKLKLKIITIENWDLKEIFNEIKIDEYLKDFSNNSLLRNLILNGYINENYNDYISLFHEVSVTKDDHKFERNVRSGYSSDFNYKLSDRVENLVNKIDNRYFEREVILNFDLLDFLGTNYIQYSDKYDAVIRLLSNEKVKSIQFIDEYIKNEQRPLGIFIEKLVENWTDFWEYIYLESNYTEEKVDKYLELVIRFSKNENILKSQNKNNFILSIDSKSYFLSLVKNTEELDYFGKITQLIKELNIDFDKLDTPTNETKKLFDYVYNNNHYKINKDNVLQMLLIFGNGISEEDFNRSNYSTLLKSECNSLIEYVNSNIDVYVEEVFLKLENNKFEDENSLIEMLNNNDLEFELKVQIIEKVETKISDLSKISELDVKKQLLKNNKVTALWKNVIDYFTISENVINEILIEYLEIEEVNNILYEIELEEVNKSFEIDLLKCNEISDETYIKLLDSCYFKFKNLNFENLNEDKVVGLVDKILSTTKDNYDLLKEHFPNNHIKLIEKNFTKFIEALSDFETDKNDVLLLLQSTIISMDNQFRYIGLVEQNIISDSNEIAKEVSNIVIQKLTKIEFEYSTIESIVKNASSADNKVKLLNLYFDDIDPVNIVSLLSNVGDYNKLFEKGRPTYKKTEINNMLFSMLLAKKLIKKYYDDAWDSSKFRVTTNY